VADCQVNVSEEAAEQVMAEYRADPTLVSVFHTAIMEVFPVAQLFWKK